jgi:hypothetical protein
MHIDSSCKIAFAFDVGILCVKLYKLIEFGAKIYSVSSVTLRYCLRDCRLPRNLLLAHDANRCLKCIEGKPVSDA